MTIAAERPAATTAPELIRRSQFFSECGDEDLELVSEKSRFETFPAGAEIVREGEQAMDVFILSEGRASVWKEGTASGRYQIATLGPGDSFGEMALLDPGLRSATVTAETPVRALVIPIDVVLQLSQTRPVFVRALVGLARTLASRLRQSNSTAVESLERALVEERTRTTMGRFTFTLIVVYSLYIWILGTATQLKASLGRSEFITVPAILIICGILVWFVRTTGYGMSFFGINALNWRRQVVESLGLTALLMVFCIALKAALVAFVPSMQGQPLIQMLGGGTLNTPATAFNPWLTLAYVIFAPFQELIYRGSLQGALAHFLTGPWRNWLAIIGSNIIFSAAHLYISPGLSITAFFAGLFWGWMYARHKSLVGVSLSHVILGFWAFEVVDLGVLE